MPLTFLSCRLVLGFMIEGTLAIVSQIFFKQLFPLSLLVPAYDMLNLFDNVILDEENLVMCSIPLENEIFEALISIGATKAPGPKKWS
jgi:hypothetical protein